MRIPLFSLFMTSPFAGIQEHSEKVKECAWAFQQAMECYMADDCHVFDEHAANVSQMEREADAIKRRIRGHLPKGTLLPVHKFLLFRYLREQDGVIDALKSVLKWMSYREEHGIPDHFKKDIALLVDSVIEAIESLEEMVKESRSYFKSFSEKQRSRVKDIIRDLRHKEHAADQVESGLKHKIFSMETDPVVIYHMVVLVEKIGDIADHAENAGDMMRAMIAK